MGQKSFVINRRSGWESGTLENGSFIDDSIKLENVGSAYFSTALDSLETGMVWDKFRMNFTLFKDAKPMVCLFASDSKLVDNQQIKNLYASLTGKKPESSLTVDDIVLSGAIGAADKLSLMGEFTQISSHNPENILLYSLRGRYLWYFVRIFSYEGGHMMLDDVQIEFPRLAFVNYLPQIYRGGEHKDSFLARFIAIYQTIYLEIENKIDTIHHKLNPEITDPVFLDWLASWFSLKDRHIWSDDKLRELIPELIGLYKIKGTKKSIKEVVRLYTGHEPIVIERFEIDDNEYYSINRDLIDKLYGDNGYTYTVLVESKHTESIFAELLRLIRQFQPAEMILNLVALGEEIYLDQHSYLGMNSYLSPYQDIVLNEGHYIPGAAL